MLSSRNSFVFLATTLAIAFPTVAHAQASAHAMVVAGRAGHVGGGTFDCATSGPQAKELGFFNTGVGLPTEGYGYCGLSGGFENVAGATSSGLAHQDTTVSFNKGTATVSADAKASIGSLSVRASGSNTSESFDGFNYASAEGAAYYSDSVKFDGTGTKLMQFAFSIDGSALVTGNSQALTLFNYQFNDGPIYGAFVGNALGANVASVRNVTGSGVDPLPGFTISAGAFDGAGLIYTFNTEITLGEYTDMTFGLYAAAYPASFGGTANNDFFSTAKLVAINIVDGAGNTLPDVVSGVSTSGYTYDGDGAHALTAAVPEPGSWALMIIGFGLAGSALRRRSVTAFLKQARS